MIPTLNLPFIITTGLSGSESCETCMFSCMETAPKVCGFENWATIIIMIGLKVEQLCKHCLIVPPSSRVLSFWQWICFGILMS